MANKGLSQLSGKVRVRGFSRLDSDRTTFLSLDQAEPNLGLPADSGGILISTADGSRLFTRNITLSGLLFDSNSLDSVVGGDERHVLGILDPTDKSSVGIISIRELLDSVTAAARTLQLVTEAGDSTSLAITLGGLLLTGADSDANTTSLLVRNSVTDSVGIRSFRSLVNDFRLISQGDSATLNGLVLTRADSDATTNQLLVINLATDSVGKRSFLSLAQDANVVFQNDTITANGLSIASVDSDSSTTDLLVINLATDSVGRRSFTSLVNEANLGNDTLQTVTDRGDSSSNKIVVGGLVLTTSDSDSDTSHVLVKNLQTDSVGIRSFASLLTDANIGADTLQTVTDRGDSTSNDVLINGASLTADSVRAETGFFDRNNNPLIIYDSTGVVLWGS